MFANQNVSCNILKSFWILEFFYLEIQLLDSILFDYQLSGQLNVFTISRNLIISDNVLIINPVSFNPNIYIFF